MPEDYKIGLDQLIVRPSDNITKDHVLISFMAEYGWTEVFTAGNISTIIGKAKSRKTFFTTLLIVGALTNRIRHIKSEVDGDVVLFDTEQGKFHVWRITKRVERMIGEYPSRIKTFGLRPLTTIDRVDIIEKYIYTNNPQLVFIDGVRDLVTDINSAEQATEIVCKLMKWSYDLNCHICNVLHQNKADDNARGHIGTEIVNKSETVLSVTKMKDKTFSLVKSEYSRGPEIKEFQFRIEGGIPEIDETDMQAYHESDTDNPF